MTQRRVYNGKPESGHRDTGCGEKGWPTSCLNCELDFCRYDTEPGGGQALLTQQHKNLVWSGWGDGLEVPEIVARTGLSLSTVYRILREE